MIMKSIELTIWQRFAILQVLGSLRGDLSVMRRGSKIMDKVELTSEEKNSANVQSVGQSISWEGTATKVIEFSEPEFALIKRTVKEYQGWNMSSMDELFDLVDKLEIEDAS
jgi:hypothetical protein